MSEREAQLHARIEALEATVAELTAEAEDADEWDTRTEVALAAFIRRWLGEHPPPAGSQIAGGLERYAERLEAAARLRAEALGMHGCLRLVEGEQ